MLGMGVIYGNFLGEATKQPTLCMDFRPLGMNPPSQSDLSEDWHTPAVRYGNSKVEDGEDWEDWNFGMRTIFVHMLRNDPE